MLGGQKYAVRVQVDPDRLRAQGIGINEIDQLLQNSNVNLPTGQLFGPTGTFTIRANGQLMTADAFRPMILGFHNRAPVRLDQVATVIDSVEDNHSASWLFDPDRERRAILVSVQKQPGSNTLEVIDSIKGLLPQISSQLPPAIHLIQGTDRALSIRAAFKDIKITMVATLVLVVFVIYLFLQNASATLIPALALPFSILGTFVVMRLMHFSLNNMSLMALILSFGFVVDDAIVMLENIVRHLEEGADPWRATMDGSREVGFTILSMTVSLAAVFIPVLFLGGILGRLFREFAVTITAAVVISGLVSVSLTPMLCSRLLKARPSGRRRAVGRPRLRRVPPPVQPQPDLRAAAPVRRAGAVLRGARRDHADVPRRAQGIHPRPGRRLDQHRAARGARHRLRGDVRERPAGREPGAHQPQPAARRRLSRQRPRRRRRHEYRPRRDAHEAARRPRQHRAGNRRADAAAAGALSRVPHLRDPAAGAADRRPPGRQQLQRHAAQPGHRAALRLGRQVSGGDRAAAARAGRVQRSGNQEPARPAGDRSRQGGGGGARSGRDLGRALQRLRAEVVVDDLRRRGAVPRAARARSQIPDQHRRARPPRVQDAARRDGAARFGGAHGRGRQPADGQPLGAAAGGGDLVRPAARASRSATRSTRFARSARGCCRRR